MKLRSFIDPHMIARHYLLRDIRFIVQKYFIDGSVLDVGCGDKPYKKLFLHSISYNGIDFKSYSRNSSFGEEKPDYYFSKNYKRTLKLPFQAKSFSHAVAFQVLEHHKNPFIMISEMARVIKKGGYILISAPFIWGLHELPHDYFRYTESGLRELFRSYGCEIVDIKKQGSLFSTIATLTTDYVIEVANRSRFHYVLGIAVFPLFLGFSYCCFLLDKLFRSDYIFLNYVILAKKLR